MQTLQEVVKKAIMQAKVSRINHWYFLEYAIDGLRYLNLHVINDGREWKKLTIDSTNRADFPADFEDFIGLYEPISGELWPLTRNDSIVPTTTLSGLTETLDSTQEEGVDITNPLDNGAYVKGGVNIRGYYTIDWINSKFIFNGTTATTMVLLYKTSGTYISATTYVYNKYIPFLIAYILYEHAKFDDSYPLSRRQELEATLNTQRNELGRLESPTLDEFLDAIRNTYYGTARR